MTKALSMLALEGEIDLIFKALKDDPECVNKIDSDGRTLLHWAGKILYLSQYPVVIWSLFNY